MVYLFYVKWITVVIRVQGNWDRVCVTVNVCQSAESRLFSVLAPQWWNELPTNNRTAESLATFCKILKTHLFRLHLDPAKHDSLPTWKLCFLFYSIDSDMLQLLSCDKCTFCQLLWTKASAKCPKSKCNDFAQLAVVNQWVAATQQLDNG